ncbi:hypothetical protein [uncultured Tyzzerella sp.]|uniref:hypothetical protein n=1 Tax=uncultured Tyzzerella sp. TaxID=2321398 RepID=UPI0029421BD9|nr:hypothetical protein [uncultured Tyzzerella sp.]
MLIAGMDCLPSINTKGLKSFTWLLLGICFCVVCESFCALIDMSVESALVYLLINRVETNIVYKNNFLAILFLF